MAWVDDVGWVEDAPAAPASYADQVALAQSWGVPADQIASVVGTPQSVAANNQAQAQAIQEQTGSAPSWSQDVGYTPSAPSWLNPADYTSSGYAAPYTQQQITSQIDPSWIRQMNGQTYASVKGPSDLSGGEYLIDPNTGRFALDKNGNPIGVTYPQSNGFSDWVTTPAGGLTMLALLGAGGLGINALAGAGALGGGAAGSGSWGLSPELAAELGLEGSTSGLSTNGLLGSQAIEALGLGAEAAGSGSWGLSPELAAELGLDYSTSGLTDLSGEAGSALLESMGLNTGMALPSWLSSLASPLAKLGASGLANALKQGSSNAGSLSGLSPILGKLAQGQSGYGMETPGIVRTNVNPFFNTPQAPIQNKEKTELSSIPDLLRQKSSWQT